MRTYYVPGTGQNDLWAILTYFLDLEKKYLYNMFFSIYYILLYLNSLEIGSSFKD